ncbi:hypothetical protein evm_008397 [Chilo suppressalis]|nr:hypothetical protein evm_008397 [Chilo suppressalis]
MACMNCHILLRQNIQLHEYNVTNLSSELVSIVEEWCGLEVSINDQLCQACLMLVIREAANHDKDPSHHPEREIGHSCVYVCCGVSLSTQSERRHPRLPSRSVPAKAWVCHACWMRAYENHPLQDDIIEIPPIAFVESPSDRNAFLVLDPVELDSSVPASSVLPSSESSSWAGAGIANPSPNQNLMKLPNYRRIFDSPNHCFFFRWDINYRRQR